MIRRKICSKCYNVVWANGLCQYHDKVAHPEKYEIKSRGTSGLKSNTIIKRTGIKSKPRKATGERQMFMEIWSERPHICINCLTHLGDEPIVHYFSHRKPKGMYPELRLVKANIDLLCTQCHIYWETNPNLYRAKTKNP